MVMPNSAQEVGRPDMSGDLMAWIEMLIQMMQGGGGADPAGLGLRPPGVLGTGPSGPGRADPRDTGMQAMENARSGAVPMGPAGMSGGGSFMDLLMSMMGGAGGAGSLGATNEALGMPPGVGVGVGGAGAPQGIDPQTLLMLEQMLGGAGGATGAPGGPDELARARGQARKSGARPY